MATALSHNDKEGIYQLYLVYGNYVVTGRKWGCTRQTVAKIVKEMEDVEPEIQKQRLTAMSRTSGKLHSKVNEILDSITVEDVKSEKLRDKAIAIGIFTDKNMAVQQHLRFMEGQQAMGALLLPTDIQALQSGIQQKIKSLSAVNIQFAEQNPDLLQRTVDAVQEADAVVNDVTEHAEVVSVDDFDGQK